MRTLKNPRDQLEETRHNLLKLQENDKEKQRAKRQKYTTVTEFLNGVYPRLGASAPRRLREKAIMEHTSHHLEAAERRLEACERCPVGGGACDDDNLGHRPGLQPTWGKGESGRVELLLVGCSKWREWLSRGRLKRAGVEPRLVHYSLDDLEGRVDKGAPHLLKFVEESRAQSSPNLVVAGAASVPVAIGLLRSTLAYLPDADAHFVRVPQQAGPLKQHYADPKKHEHPLKPLMTVGLLFLVEISVYKASWFDDELRDLVYTRYLNNLPTALVTEGNEGNMLATHYFRTTVPVVVTK